MKINITDISISTMNQNVIKYNTYLDGEHFTHKITVNVPKTNNPIYIPIIEDFEFSDIVILKNNNVINASCIVTKTPNNKTKGLVCFLDEGEYNILLRKDPTITIQTLKSLFYSIVNSKHEGNLVNKYFEIDEIINTSYFTYNIKNNETNAALKLSMISDKLSAKEESMAYVQDLIFVSIVDNDLYENQLSLFIKNISRCIGTTENSIITKDKILGYEIHPYETNFIYNIENIIYETFLKEIDCINNNHPISNILYSYDIFYKYNNLLLQNIQKNIITNIMSNNLDIYIYNNISDLFQHSKNTIIQNIYTNTISNIIPFLKINTINQNVNIIYNSVIDLDFIVSNKLYSQIDTFYITKTNNISNNDNSEVTSLNKIIITNKNIYCDTNKYTTKQSIVCINTNIQEINSNTLTKV